MYKPDEDIDRLSREAAEHYNAPGKPAWEALRETLDKELPQEKEKKRRGFLFFFLLGLGLFLSAGTIWYGTQVHLPVTTTEKPAAKQPDQAFPNTTTASKPLPVKEREKKPAVAGSSKNNITLAREKNSGSHLTATAADPRQTELATTLPTTGAGEVPKNNAVPLQTTGLRRMHKKQQLPVAVRPNSSNHPVGLPLVSNAAAQQVNPNNKKARVSAEDKGIEPNNTATDIAAGLKKDGGVQELPSGATGQDVPANDSASNKSPQPLASVLPAPTDTKPVVPEKTAATAKAAANIKNKSVHQQAILLGLTAGLDMSTVKFRYGTDAGYNFGFLGGYQFSSHWSAYTGISYTKKNYKLNGEDYNPPRHYWTQYVQLETVEGYCRMWELPLLARYTFNPGTKTAFFVSTGMSSYFMKRQVYDYYYKTSAGPTNTVWTNDSSFNHIFNILDLSAGIEKRIGRHMSWQIEPYARIPLGGVGFGNIRLSSFGVNFTVQYRQPVKR